MSTLSRSILVSLEYMLLPIVRYAVRHGLKIQDFSEVLKKTFIQAAEEEILCRSVKVNVSKLSIASGVHRKDIYRIQRSDSPTELSIPAGERVIGQWRGNKRFCTAAGNPRVLSYKGEDSEFTRLVRGVYNDVGPVAILFDLERLGAIEYTSRGIKLTSRAYVPRRNPTEIYKMLGADVQDLISGVISNMESHDGRSRNFHAKTVYENLDRAAIPKIQSWLFEQCSKFQMKVDRYIRRFDLDIEPKPNSIGGGRVAYGSFVDSNPFLPGKPKLTDRD